MIAVPHGIAVDRRLFLPAALASQPGEFSKSTKLQCPFAEPCHGGADHMPRHCCAVALQSFGPGRARIGSRSRQEKKFIVSGRGRTALFSVARLVAFDASTATRA
jgi:hypothetical protein